MKKVKKMMVGGLSAKPTVGGAVPQTPAGLPAPRMGGRPGMGPGRPGFGRGPGGPGFGPGGPRGPMVRPMTQPPAPMKKGGKVSSASKRADGIATKGKTKGHMV